VFAGPFQIPPSDETSKSQTFSRGAEGEGQRADCGHRSPLVCHPARNMSIDPDSHRNQNSPAAPVGKPALGFSRSLDRLRISADLRRTPVCSQHLVIRDYAPALIMIASSSCHSNQDSLRQARCGIPTAHLHQFCPKQKPDETGASAKQDPPAGNSQNPFSVPPRSMHPRDHSISQSLAISDPQYARRLWANLSFYMALRIPGIVPPASGLTPS
jgi:hypothetical protein